MVIPRAAALVAMVMPAATAVGEKDAATHAQHDQQGNQQGDSTEHFKNPLGYSLGVSGVGQAKAFHRL